MRVIWTNKGATGGGTNVGENCVIERIPYAKTNVGNEGTNVHSGFTRHMTAAAATLNKTTPSAVEYRATQRSLENPSGPTTFESRRGGSSFAQTSEDSGVMGY